MIATLNKVGPKALAHRASIPALQRLQRRALNVKAFKDSDDKAPAAPPAQQQQTSAPAAAGPAAQAPVAPRALQALPAHPVRYMMLPCSSVRQPPGRGPSLCARGPLLPDTRRKRSRRPCRKRGAEQSAAWVSYLPHIIGRLCAKPPCCWLTAFCAPCSPPQPLCLQLTPHPLPPGLQADERHDGRDAA